MALNKCKAGLWIVSLVLVMVLAPGYCAGAAAPTSEAMVPLVPGAVPDHQAEAFWEEYTGPGGVYLFVDGYELPLVSEAHAFYSIGAPLEDVARYYVMELGAVEAYGIRLISVFGEGVTTPIYVEYAFYDWQFEDSYDYGKVPVLSHGCETRANRFPIPQSWLSTAVSAGITGTGMETYCCWRLSVRMGHLMNTMRSSWVQRPSSLCTAIHTCQRKQPGRWKMKPWTR